MSMFETELEALDFLAALGMGLCGGYDPILDCYYWYIGGDDGRMEYKSLNRQECIDWVDSRAHESLLWAYELRRLGKAPLLD